MPPLPRCPSFARQGAEPETRNPRKCGPGAGTAQPSLAHTAVHSTSFSASHPRVRLPRRVCPLGHSCEVHFDGRSRTAAVKDRDWFMRPPAVTDGNTHSGVDRQRRLTELGALWDIRRSIRFFVGRAVAAWRGADLVSVASCQRPATIGWVAPERGRIQVSTRAPPRCGAAPARGLLRSPRIRAPVGGPIFSAPSWRRERLGPLGRVPCIEWLASQRIWPAVGITKRSYRRGATPSKRHHLSSV